MGLTYSDVLASRFGEGEFTTRDLSLITGTSRAAKLLSDLKFKGIVERVGHGRYRLLKPSERPDIRVLEWERVRRIILKAPWTKAFVDSSAVEVWTNGSYIVSRSAFIKVFHISIIESDHSKWINYLNSSGVSIKGKKKVGAFVDLIPVKSVKYELKNGEPVIPKDETIKLIKDHPGLYAGAEELIEE